MTFRPAYHLFCLAFLLNAPVVAAAQNTYQCVISELLQLGDDGALRRPPDPWLVGKRFAVDRNTGTLLGPETSFWSFTDSRPTILARGNESNSFVVALVSDAAGNGVHATKIVVNEFKSGPIKPFVVLTGSQVASGTCQ